MKLGDIIPNGAILDDIKASEKEDVIKEMVAALVKVGRIEEANSKKVIKALMDREKMRANQSCLPN